MKVLTFDIEIRNKIPMRSEKIDPHFEYCEGWGDYAGMGISFLGAHTSWDDKITFYDENNLHKFDDLCFEADIITGYNILGFDIPLFKATYERLEFSKFPSYSEKIYDIFQDIRKAKRSAGWKLDQVAKATLGWTKSGDGAQAPELWQRGKYAELINYLAQDVRVEAALFQHVLEHGTVSNGVKTIELPGIKNIQALNSLL